MAFIIVEDDSAVADALGALLASAGHDVRVHSSAERLFDFGPPRGSDTVIVDLGLPGLSGRAVLRWLAALREPPRIIVISGKSSSVIERETQDMSRVEILRKPPSADWLEVMTA